MRLVAYWTGQKVRSHLNIYCLNAKGCAESGVAKSSEICKKTAREIKIFSQLVQKQREERLGLVHNIRNKKMFFIVLSDKK